MEFKNAVALTAPGRIGRHVKTRGTQPVPGLAAGLFLCLLGAGGPLLAENLLKPGEAFRYTVAVVEEALVVRWVIEPGHYLYRERMSFSSATPG